MRKNQLQELGLNTVNLLHQASKDHFSKFIFGFARGMVMYYKINLVKKTKF